MPDVATFLYGPAWHHIDHLAPLAQTLGIPLIVTDEEIEDGIKRFYPAVNLKRMDRFEAATYVTEEYSSIISCLPKVEIDQLFFFAQYKMRKPIVPIWCPHGQSDKGAISGFLTLLKEERAALLYGRRMMDQVTHEVLKHLRGFALLGHYRLQDYKKHKSFYDEKTQVRLKALKPSRRTFLYAPTWNDSEDSSSFFSAYHELIEHLPKDTNLIIKPHPNLVWQNPSFFEKIREELDGHSHILLLEDFPLIMPLLTKCDVYIGDASSIGYDYLAFDKPMIFLNQNERDSTIDQGLYLYKCGIQILPPEYSKIYEKIENLLPYDKDLFSEIRKEVYHYAFGEELSASDLKSSIATLLERTAYNDLEKDFLLS
jgi:hypothetical protein